MDGKRDITLNQGISKLPTHILEIETIGLSEFKLYFQCLK